MAATPVKQVFISHATTADGEFAQRLAGDLRRLGVPVWITPDSILEGEPWVRAIERGLSESSHVVIVLTPAAMESQWVEIETNTAIALERKERIKVIPLDVKACDVPLLLGNYQMVRFRRGYDAGLSRLARVLGLSLAAAEPVPVPRQASQPTPAPEAVGPPVVKSHEPIEPELIHIPAGEFLMGSTQEQVKQFIAQGLKKEWVERELPQHRLHLPEYYIAKTPVTIAQYAVFSEATGWGKQSAGKADHPVVNVSWHDAMAYSQWLAKATGKAYRLPSEAEWEKAARGTEGRIYPWGDEPPDKKRCNFGGDWLKGDTTPVGHYSPQGDSPYGCVDMSGNVWEWTSSLWGKDLEKPDFKYPYDPADGREDLKASDDIRRVVRGGAFYGSDERDIRCACRVRYSPDDRNYLLGFRVCVAAQQE